MGEGVIMGWGNINMGLLLNGFFWRAVDNWDFFQTLIVLLIESANVKEDHIVMCKALGQQAKCMSGLCIW